MTMTTWAWAERKRRILVITPSNLRKQWYQELTEKFFLPCRILESKSYNAAIKTGNFQPFSGDDIVICSYQFARSKASDVANGTWDLAVIDIFLREQRPELLISSGFAGGARSDQSVGDLILAENFSDGALLGLAQRILGARAQTARVFTSGSIVDSIAERNQIAQANAAAAIDMETEVIAQACAARGIPLLSLRVISDTPRQPFPAPPHILFDIERQRTNGAKLAAYVLLHPTRIPRLIRFANQIARAREVLTDALLSLVREFKN